MNRANMAKQITEVPMAGCKPKGMMKGGMVKTGYKKGGKVTSSRTMSDRDIERLLGESSRTISDADQSMWQPISRCAASKWRWG
jgi:hypothetical protein